MYINPVLVGVLGTIGTELLLIIIYALYKARRNVTIQGCIDMYEKKGQATIINDGKVTGFVRR